MFYGVELCHKFKRLKLLTESSPDKFLNFFREVFVLKLILISLLIYGFVIAFLYYKKNKEEKEKKLLPIRQEEDFVGLLRQITHRQLLFLCLDSDEPIHFKISLEESSNGPLFVFSLNNRVESINIREEMKKVTFKKDGSIVYGEELVKAIRDAISSVNAED